MTANELKYTYMEEAMSILDNEELMRNLSPIGGYIE